MGAVEAVACYRELGADLRRIRESAGLSGQELADRVARERSRLSRIESGTKRPGDAEVVQYAITCGLRSSQAMALVAQRQLAEHSTAGYWLSESLRSLAFHESTADSMVMYDPMVVNGLLQTEDYARAVMSVERWRGTRSMETGAELRLARQQVLHQSPPAGFAFFVQEDAVRRRFGGTGVMHEQLLHMVLLSALSHISVRVVLAGAGEESSFGGSFQMLGFERYKPLVYLDNLTNGLFLEDPPRVAEYRHLTAAIADVALDEQESREFLASLASEFDRGSAPDADTSHLEEEQLQRRQ